MLTFVGDTVGLHQSKSRFRFLRIPRFGVICTAVSLISLAFLPSAHQYLVNKGSDVPFCTRPSIGIDLEREQ